MMKRLSILLHSIMLTFTTLGQAVDSAIFEDPPSSIYEVAKQIDPERTVFYFNERWELVKPKCAVIYRISGINTALATYGGDFADYYFADSTKAVEGRYQDGKKQGRFNVYYPNGQLQQSGEYRDDQKVGRWEYYYEDGVKRQVLEFLGDEILIAEFWSEDGVKMIEAGNGEWFFSRPSHKYSRIFGKVVDGKRDGTWKISTYDRITHKETFRNGKFMGGKLISSFAGVESYSDTSFCSVEWEPMFLRAEHFQFEGCIYSPKGDRQFARFPGGMTRFYHQVRERLAINGPVTRPGVMCVQMTIDEQGNMTNFKHVSSLGYEDDLIRALQKMGKWIPSTFNGRPTIDHRWVRIEIR